MSAHDPKNHAGVVTGISNLGQKLGHSPEEWAAVLTAASILLQKRFGFTIQAPTVEVVDCPCPKCTKEREDKKRREGIHVVN